MLRYLLPALLLASATTAVAETVQLRCAAHNSALREGIYQDITVDYGRKRITKVDYNPRYGSETESWGIVEITDTLIVGERKGSMLQFYIDRINPSWWIESQIFDVNKRPCAVARQKF